MTQYPALLPIVGIALVTATTLWASGLEPLAVPFMLWAALPYGALWIATRRTPSSWPAVGAGLAAIATELGIRAAVFVWPRGSTAAIALVFSPLVVGLMAMPVGAALGWAARPLWHAHPIGRVLIALVAPVALGLTALGFARPDLFPTTVMARRAQLERIGPPRIAVGADAFTWTTISTASAWHVAGDFDAAPGEEIAIVDHRGAELLDGRSLAVLRRVEFQGPPGRLWGSFSTLVRAPDDRLLVADTGGGYSATRLKDLTGAVVWEYRPDATLPPSAMRPADLDRDGQIEFYAASTDRVSRLGSDGHERWRHPASLAAIQALLPSSDAAPGWVVAIEYGRRVQVLSDSGQLVHERPATVENTPVSAIETAHGRAFVYGGRSARHEGLDGRVLFEMPLGEFTLAQAVSVRFTPDAPSIVLVGTTDHDIGRWRVLVLGPDFQVRFDEILAAFPRLLTAERDDGTHALLIATDVTLRQLSPRAAH